MKRLKFAFKIIAATTVIFLFSQVLTSCKKDNPAPVVADVISTKGPENLKGVVTQASTLATLSTEFKTAAATITTVLTPAQVTAVATANFNPDLLYYQTAIVLSTNEVTKLKANDPTTLSQVLTRMLRTPSFLAGINITNMNAALAANALLSVYLVKSTGSATNLYAGDYYQAALDAQKFVSDYIIFVIQRMIVLQSTGTKSASIIYHIAALTPVEEQFLASIGAAISGNSITFQNKVYSSVAELKTIHNL